MPYPLDAPAPLGAGWWQRLRQDAPLTLENGTTVRGEPAVGLYQDLGAQGVESLRERARRPGLRQKAYDVEGKNVRDVIPPQRIDFRPVDHDPFMQGAAPTTIGNNVTLTPVDHDPFMEAAGEHIMPSVSRAIGGVVSNLATLPQRFVQGATNQTVTEDDPTGRGKLADAGAETALTLAGGGTTFAPRNALGIFGGAMAKTADRQALDLATKMTEQGYGRRQIWDATGWFQGADTKWRFEIPDQNALYNMGGLKFNGGEIGAKRAPLGDTLLHPALFQAYPDMAKMRADTVLGMSQSGHYMPSSWHGEFPEAIDATGKTPRSIEEVLLHEAQHTVQRREGFATGGGFDDPDYYRLAGEVEARNVHKQRRFMSTEERRATPPWATEDVPLEQQRTWDADRQPMPKLEYRPIDYDPFK